MRLRQIAFWLFVAPMVAVCTQPVRAHPPTIVSESGERVVGEEIQAFRKAMADAIRAKDAAQLQAMYARRFSYTDAAGVTHAREAHIAAALAGQPMIETAAARDVQVRVPNDWVAVVTGTSALPSAGAGPAQPVKWLAVYTRHEKSWVLVAQQATRSDAQR